MNIEYLHSVLLEILVEDNITIRSTTGHLSHSIFLNLVGQTDVELSQRLHNEPGYRPFTVSMLRGEGIQANSADLSPGQTCYIRVTFLDGSQLWRSIATKFYNETIYLQLNRAKIKVIRLIASSTNDPSGWAGLTTWQTLSTITASPHICLQFASPTAFHIKNKAFCVLPEPILIWGSLIRSWNRYSPAPYKLEEEILLDFVRENVELEEAGLHTVNLNYPKYTQKGFVGTSTFEVSGDPKLAAQVAALATFAQYAGVGYKTTMGMGQVKAEIPKPL